MSQLIARLLTLALLPSLLWAQAPRPQSRPESRGQGSPPAYVPSDLADAHAELLRILPSNVVVEIRAAKEADMIRYHLDLGMWLRNNWGLWRSSRLSRFFNRIGIHHPDDMSGIILDTFWCHLHGTPWRLNERVAYYQEFWRANAQPPPSKCPTCKARLRIPITLDVPGPLPRAIHVGRCRRGHVWVYEYTSGWYKPDPTLMARILEP